MAAPKVYLSPAMHRANPCVYPRPDGQQCYEALENNEYIDILEPILHRCGIATKRGYRRTPMNGDDGDKIMRQNVAESNAWGADVHYVSHTNASSNGKAQGCHPMYYASSKNGKKLGEIMVKHRKLIYPRTVKLVARSDLYELKNTNAVAFYEEHAFHDNLEDITWFHTHMKEIAESAAKGLCEWFGIPYVEEDKRERNTCWWETFANSPQSGAASAMSMRYSEYQIGDFLINLALGYVFEVTGVTVGDNTSGIQYEYKGTLNRMEDASGVTEPAEPANPTPGELLVRIMNSSDGVGGTWELVK